MPEDKIVVLDENSEIRKKNTDYYKGLAEEGVEWPVEIQGTGQSSYKKKEFKVGYPVGDIFVSFAIQNHEMGHLRQGGIDDRFSVEELGPPNPKELKETELHNKIEENAWRRGLHRAEEYCPEFLKEIENRFQVYKKQGKYENFNNFKEFYKYISEVGLTITRLNDEFEYNKELSNLEKGKILGRLIKNDPFTNKFFTEQDKWRTGEIIDKNFAENFIKKAAERIAEEEY